jgi:hypothetical protein
MGGGSKTTTTNQNEQAVTVPQNPTYALDPVKNYYAGIGNYQQADPYAFVTPPNSLQTAAYQNAASGLFGANDLYGQAASGANAVLNSAPTAVQAGQTQAGLANLGNAAQATPQYAGGPVAANAATAGTAAQTATPDLGNAAQAQAASLLDNLQAYQNPYTQQVVDSTLADFDNQAGINQAKMMADGARAGAFGGSRFAIAQSALLGEQERARAATAANLRSNAFNTAAGLSAQDAGFRQGANLFNAGATNQRDETRAGLQAQTGMFNADAQNQYGLANAGFQQQSNLFNAGAANDVNALNAQLGTQTNQFNTGAQNQFGLAQFDAGNQLSQFNAGQANQLGQFNAAQSNDMQNAQLSRMLQASGLLGDIGSAYGSNYRADLGTQADMGNMLWTQQNAYNQAPLTQLQNVGNLLNPGLIDTVSGRTVTGQNSGVTKEQQSGGLFNTLLGIGSLAVPFIPK